MQIPQSAKKIKTKQCGDQKVFNIMTETKLGCKVNYYIKNKI